MSSVLNPGGITPITPSTGTKLLNDWASLIAGEWTMSFSPSPATTAAALVGPFVHPNVGTLAATPILGGKAIEGSFNLGSITGKTTVALDHQSGQLKQTTVNSDGTTVTGFIQNQGGGQWAVTQDSAAAAGQVETSLDLITVADGGSTLIHRVTNRKLNGQPEPDLQAVFKRKATVTTPIPFPTQAATAIPITGTGIPNLMNDWANVVVGRWSSSFAPAPRVTAAGSLSPFVRPTNGTTATTRILGNTAVESTFNLGGVSGKTTVAMDSSTGALRQTTINSDGSTVVGYITSLGAGQFAVAQDSVAAAGQVESSLGIITVSDWGNTITNHMTNRVGADGQPQPDLVGVFKRTSNVAVPIPINPIRNAAATVGSDLLSEWGNTVAGQWKMSFVGDAQDSSVPTGGNSSAAFLMGSTALEGTFNMGNTSGKWTAVTDAKTGQLRQDTVTSDGTTVVGFIQKVAAGQFVMNQTSSFSNGSQEISTDNITVGDAGNTITHRITKRMRDGKAEPDFSGSYTRAAAASTTA